MYPVGSMKRYVNRVAAQYRFIDPDAVGVCTGGKDGLTTARFGGRNCYGPPDYFADALVRKVDVIRSVVVSRSGEAVARSIAAGFDEA